MSCRVKDMIWMLIKSVETTHCRLICMCVGVFCMKSPVNKWRDTSTRRGTK